MLVFDFCEDTSLEAYNDLYKKIETLDISVLVNNVGIALPTERSPVQVYREIAANCYPVVLLTQQLVGKFEERFSKNKNRSIIINLSSQAALMPMPHFKNYSATKVFDDFFSKSARKSIVNCHHLPVHLGDAKQVATLALENSGS